MISIGATVMHVCFDTGVPADRWDLHIRRSGESKKA